MRVAVVSDIHGNLHALEAVLLAAAAAAVDEVWCLGDVVGYGPRPAECCELVRARAAVCLAGNHDLGAVGVVPLDEFSADAGIAARWTASVLDDDARSFLASLPTARTLEHVALAHGSPRDPVWEYILGWDQAADALALAQRPLVLVGHTHVAAAFTEGETINARVAPAGTEVDLAPPTRAVLNPGSVGQPRDGDPRAAWLLLDLTGPRAAFQRVEYPVERTQAEIVEAGLPEGLALRLAEGL